MRDNWKRFSFGAFLLASLLLLLFGCGDYSGSGSQTAQKSISGVVSDPAAGLALPDAKVTAYGVDAGGSQSSIPLSNPPSVQSDSKGRYRLLIPANYGGPVIIEATKSVSPVAKLARLLFALPAADVDLRAAVPQNLVNRATIPPVMVSFATNMVLQYLMANNSAVFSSDNIEKATILLETFFGFNFTQVPPPVSAADNTTSKAQQDLLVSIQAINSYANGSAAVVTQIVTALHDGPIGAGIADSIKLGISAAVSALQAQGILPVEYVPSAAINTAISNAQFIKAETPDLTDTTPPAAPSGLAVGGTTAKSVMLGWSPSADATVAGFLVYRADGSGVYLLIGSAGPGSTAYSDFSAAPAATYSYQVVAFDGNRNLSDISNTVTVTTPAAADLVPPSAPAGLVCRGIDDAQVNLQWLESTKTQLDGTVLPAVRYNVYRDAQFIGSTAETSYIDRTVSPSVSYRYFVKASDGFSNLSPASTALTVRTSATPGVVTPPAPTGLQLAAPQNFNNTPLVWTAPASAGQVTYNVYRDAVLIATGIASASYNDDTVTPNSNYVYTVTTVANSIESAQGAPFAPTPTPANPALSDPDPPTVPTNLSVVSATSVSVSLAWAASTKVAGDQVVAGYDILRGDGSGNNYLRIATVVLPAYTDTNNVRPSTGYSYKVESISSAGVRSLASLPATVTTPEAIDLADTTQPNPPGNLTSSSVGSSAVALTWLAATKSNADATHYVAGYLVYRNGAQIADVHSLLYFTDASATAATAYTYTVKAYDNSGNLSDPSSPFTVTTLAATPNSYTITGQVTLNGVGLYGVVLSDGVGTDQVVTDVNGNFAFTGLAAGDYTITPTPTAFCAFIPVQRSVSLDASLSGQNFTATLSGAVNGGITYPDGTVIGGISYPPGSIIGGVLYPTGATLIGGVLYPTGTVIGGIVYPGGVVIGGVRYPAGTVVGGIAFPVGAVVTGMLYPTGTVIGGVVYPTGSLAGTVGFPSGVVVGGVTYPSGVVTDGVLYPNGTVIGGISYPPGSIIGGVLYPTGATVIGGVLYPTGTVIGGIVYPNGVVVGGVSYPAGTVVGGIAFPVGAVTAGVAYPSGTVIGGVVYPTGNVAASIGYPSGVVVGGVTYPSGTVTGGVFYPTGGIISGVSYPTGSATGGVLYPSGGVISTLDYRYIIYGMVTGASGTTTVSAADPSTTSTYATTADALGNYILFVPAGIYTVTATVNSIPLSGSATVNETHVEVNTNL